LINKVMACIKIWKDSQLQIIFVVLLIFSVEVSEIMVYCLLWLKEHQQPMSSTCRV